MSLFPFLPFHVLPFLIKSFLFQFLLLLILIYIHLIFFPIISCYYQKKKKIISPFPFPSFPFLSLSSKISFIPFLYSTSESFIRRHSKRGSSFFPSLSSFKIILIISNPICNLSRKSLVLSFSLFSNRILFSSFLK